MSTVTVNTWNGALFLVLRREGKNGWNSGPPDRLMSLAVSGGRRLYLSSARRQESRRPQMVRILPTVAFALLLTDFAMAQSYCDQVRQPWLTTAHERLQLLTSV
jgi:hypothetical protein